jgi:hypothetical protein
VLTCHAICTRTAQFARVCCVLPFSRAPGCLATVAVSHICLLAGNLTLELQFKNNTCNAHYGVQTADSTRPSQISSPTTSTASRGDTTAVVGSALALLIISCLAALLYRRQRPDQAHRKAIEPQLLQALQQLNGTTYVRGAKSLAYGCFTLCHVNARLPLICACLQPS